MRYWYYPGCSLHSTGAEYDQSARAVGQALGVEFVEVEDWNCCGASSVHTLGSPEVAAALPARNVMLAQREPWDLVAPCADCFYHSAVADDRLRGDDSFRASLEATVGLRYSGQGRPRTLLHVLASDVPVAKVAARVTCPLGGLRPACYYGCLLVRPPAVARRWDDPEHPVLMGRLLGAVGAQAVRWSYAVECCGASLAISRGDVVTRLVGRIVDGAEEAGANCLVTACPMCQANLESRQGARSQEMPVFYFTELLGLAFGLPGVAGWLKKHLIDPRPLLTSLGHSL